MVGFCEEVSVAPGQLSLRAWGLINAFQVLSDLSGIAISGRMVANAYELEDSPTGSRRFELRLCSEMESSIIFPDWLDSLEEDGSYFFIGCPELCSSLRLWAPYGLLAFFCLMVLLYRLLFFIPLLTCLHS